MPKFSYLAWPILAVILMGAQCTDAQKSSAQAACDMVDSAYEYYNAVKENANVVSANTQKKVAFAISNGRALCAGIDNATTIGTVVRITAVAQSIRNAIKADPSLVIAYPQFGDLNRLAKQAGF